jgi:hypothetical protein
MVQQALRPASEEQQQKPVCRHHWMIDAPVGPVSRGVCQLCSEVRDFKNYIESAPWGDDVSASHSSGRYPENSSSGEMDDLDEA